VHPPPAVTGRNLTYPRPREYCLLRNARESQPGLGESGGAEVVRAVIVGAGEVGYRVAERLSRENKDVVIIDRDPAKTRRVRDTLDVEVLEGTGSSPSRLEQSRIRDADILVAVTDSDEANIMACLFANVLSPKTIKIARIRNPEYLAYRSLFSHETLNIHRIINPESEVVKKIVALFDAPGAIDVLRFSEGKVHLIGVEVKKDSFLAHKKLSDLGGTDFGANMLVGAVIRGETMIVPGGEYVILPGDLIYVVSSTEVKRNVLRVLNLPEEPVHKVIIIGGGHLGLSLALHLDKTHIHTRLIDSDESRCRDLANSLERVTVLRGDATNQDVLLEEKVQDADVLVAVTGDEEKNILISLLAKQMGVPRTITRVQRFSYIPLTARLGIDTVVSTHLAAIDATLQFIRKGKVMSVAALKGEHAEVIEVVAQEPSDILGIPLKKLKFPKGALIGAVVRGGSVIIPGGHSVIQSQDRLLIFALREAIPAIERLLME